MRTVLITGGTGVVGKELTKHLSGRGYHIIILTRKMPEHATPELNVSYALWNVNDRTIDVAAVQKADYIIHLAGAGVVDKRWTTAYKKEIMESRTRSSGLLSDTLLNNPHHVKAVASASAIGWYGEDPPLLKEGFVETDQHAAGFLGETCKLWEESIAPVGEVGIRLVRIRSGIVLSNTGGAYVEFKKPLKFGMAAILGSGKQVVSWIHIDDLCRIFIESLENERFHGAYNAVAPKPVTNKQLTMELAKLMRGKSHIPLHVPAFVLKLVMGESSIEVLKSTTVSCSKLKQEGFTFLYPTIDAALGQLQEN